MDKLNQDNLFARGARVDYLSVSVAFVLTILFHISLYYVIPDNFDTLDVKKEEKKELQLEIIPPEPIKRKIPEFVEANPLANQEKAPENAPESFQDQRAADEITDSTSKSPKPYVEGEIKDGKKIVSGTAELEDIISPEQAVVETIKRPLKQSAKAHEEISNPPDTAQETIKEDVQIADENNQAQEKQQSNFEMSDKFETQKKEEGIIKTQQATTQNNTASKVNTQENTKTKVVKTQETKPKEPEKPKEKEILQEEKTEEIADNEDLPTPTKRPLLSMKIPPGPLADNRVRASNHGTLAVDSRFSEFGAYQQRMIEAISRQWNLLGGRFDLSGAMSTQVIIEFMINTMGELTNLKIIFSNSSNVGRTLCQQCIQTTAPYGLWTQEMITTLGAQDQSVRITFYYR